MKVIARQPKKNELAVERGRKVPNGLHAVSPPLLFQHGCSACALKYRTDWRLTRSLPYRASLFLVYIKFVWMQIPFCTSLLLLVLFSGITFTNYSFQWALLSSKQLTASQKLFPVQWFELVYLVCLFMNNV